MTGVIKSPFKFQDLVIIEANKIFTKLPLTITPIQFTGIQDSFEDKEVVLGVGKKDSRSGKFLISRIKAFNKRDIEYINFLRFENKIKGKKCVDLKRRLMYIKVGITDLSDRDNQEGVYDITNIYSIIECYTGYNKDINSEYINKSNILNNWIQDTYDSNSDEVVDTKKIEEELVSIINRKFNTDYKKLKEFYSECPPSIKFRKHIDLKKNIEDLLKTKRKRYSSKTYMTSFMNYKTYRKWLNIWIDARIAKSDIESLYSDLWNSCNFDREYAVINTTGVAIPNWKTLAKYESGTMFFATPEEGSTNWCLITIKPNLFPLENSTDEFAYWSHVSGFLSKFETLDKLNRYLDLLTARFKTRLDEYFNYIENNE
jgi:hypothetical protein